MKKLLFLLLCSASAVLNAQTYSWQFGKQAGGETGPATSFFTYPDDESIRDITVDADNNTYYLAKMWNQEQNVDGIPSLNYGNSDLVLFSTDCQGNLRWQKTIGGKGELDSAWNIEIDNNGGIYLMANLINEGYAVQPGTIPTHLDTNVTLPVIQISDATSIDPGLKTGYLLKYNTSTGNLIWSKALQGNTNFLLRFCDSQMMYMDSQKNIHAILGFRAGTHLNGMITVPSSFTTSYQYFLVKFNYDSGNMTPSTPVLLPITGDVYGSSSIGHTNFIYDESQNRYYLAGKRRNGSYGDMIDFAFNNIPIDKEAFLIAFNLNGNTVTEAWRKEINTGFATSILDDEIHSIIKDSSTSDIYIAGRYYSNTTTAATFGSYTFPVPTYGIQRPFIMKINSVGDVQWAKIPDAIPASVNGTAYRFMKGKIVQNGNEIGFAQGSWGISWGGFTMTRPSGANADPVLFRFDKDTGSVLGMGEIYSNPGVQDEFTAIAVDNDGNYVLGGFFHQQLFTATDDNVPTMTLNVPGNRSQNFFTKYAKSACSQLSTAETTIENNQLSFYPNPARLTILH